MARTLAFIYSPVAVKDVPNTTPTPFKPGGFAAAIDDIYAAELDNEDGEVLLYPRDYDRNEIDEVEDGNDWVYWRAQGGSTRCWQTTMIYQKITPHARLVPYLRFDEWTGLPILAKPSGPALDTFLDEHEQMLFEARSDGDSNHTTASHRIRKEYLPLAYQWALQLANAMKHIHTFNAAPLHLVYGDLQISNCWLTSPSLHLSLVGFLDAGFCPLPNCERRESDVYRDTPFHPIGIGWSYDGCNWSYDRSMPTDGTLQTDVFLIGCVIYQFMTSSWPGQGQGLSREEQQQLISRQRWPQLEGAYLGDIVKKCWTSEIPSAEMLLDTLQQAIAESGWQVSGEDELQGFDAASLFSS